MIQTFPERDIDSNRRWPSARRRGVALLLCLFVILIVSVTVVSVLNTETLQYTAARHAIDYERALYLANAGVHHACAVLEDNPSWRSTVTEGTYPNSGSYSATAIDGTTTTVLITSTGVAGEVSRTVEAGIDL